METLQVVLEDAIATVTINRPKALNALSNQVFDELDTTFAELETNTDVRAIIVTGSGEKAFVAGADIKELVDLDAAGAQKVSARGQAVFRRIERCPKPVIAAVNGFALGGGCELAMACHIRVASETARLGLPEVTLGLIPGYAGTQRLPRLVGKAHAMELLLTGDMINADHAHRIGLVNHVVTPEALITTCRDMAHRIASRAPIAIALGIQAVNEGLDLTQEGGEALEASLFGKLADTEDAKEGLTAFVEKRKANFTGR